MRILLFVTIISFIALSCKKESDTPTDTVKETVDTAAVLKYAGSFMSGPYGTVTGKAGIYKKLDAYQVLLDSFITTNGPALHVYLSKEAMPVNYMDLGELKSTNGSQIYTITGMPDFADYKYVSIHCVAYNHLFGYALIK